MVMMEWFLKVDSRQFVDILVKNFLNFESSWSAYLAYNRQENQLSSVGRYIRGLFMKLLFLKKHLYKLGANALDLIDTEGFDTPEKSNDPELEKKR